MYLHDAMFKQRDNFVFIFSCTLQMYLQLYLLAVRWKGLEA